jgi:hypothetical protein
MKSTCENCGIEKLTNGLCPKCLAEDVKPKAHWIDYKWVDVMCVVLAVGALILIAIELARAF